MTQPTHSREAIQALHAALDRLVESARYADGFGTMKYHDAAIVRKALPPIPEPERSRIKPASELVVNILHQTQGRGLTTPAADLEWGIKAARAEIIALLEVEMKLCSGYALPCIKCETLRDIIKELKEAQ